LSPLSVFSLSLTSNLEREREVEREMTPIFARVEESPSLTSLISPFSIQSLSLSFSPTAATPSHPLRAPKFDFPGIITARRPYKCHSSTRERKGETERGNRERKGETEREKLPRDSLLEHSLLLEKVPTPLPPWSARREEREGGHFNLPSLSLSLSLPLLWKFFQSSNERRVTGE